MTALVVKTALKVLGALAVYYITERMRAKRKQEG